MIKRILQHLGILPKDTDDGVIRISISKINSTDSIDKTTAILELDNKKKSTMIFIVPSVKYMFKLIGMENDDICLIGPSKGTYKYSNDLKTWIEISKKTIKKE